MNPPDGGRPELLLATGNAKKQVELRHLLAPLDVRLLTPEDVGGLPEVDEDQPTFGGNAAKKARSATGVIRKFCVIYRKYDIDSC